MDSLSLPTLLSSPAVTFLVRPLEGLLDSLAPGANGALLCLAIAALQPLVPHAARVMIIVRQGKMGYRIADPRSTHADAAASGALDADAKRALSRAAGCHANCYEAFPVFAAAVLAALLAGVPQQLSNRAAALFVLIRFVYIAVYLVGSSAAMGLVRSAIWMHGLALCLALLSAAAAQLGRA